MRALAEALRMFTVIPIPGRPPRRPSAAIAAYPWAALILGALTALIGWVASLLMGPLAVAIVIVSAKIALTGGLHLDGLADLADGLGGGRDRERRLAIMADSRLGSFGALALLVVCALQAAFLSEWLLLSARLENSGTAVFESAQFPPLNRFFPTAFAVVALIPVITRGSLPLIMRLFTSARPGGMGDLFRQSATGTAAAAALISTALFAYLLAGVAGLIIGGAVMIITIAAAFRVSKTLGGLTGDCYGALIEIGDSASLLCALIVGQFLPGLL